ncbi:MAG TPA: IclR family transcriptional regulator, partial [Solirubrobacteraceae bacterium]|nr:IclR family transcriptional regulator [Solirubrobacteraceae bacterium]
EYVELDERTRRYRLGPRILTLGLAYLDRLDVRELARDAMRELVQRTDETATLSVRVGWTRAYVDQITPIRDIKMVVQLATAHPLHAGASSKAFLAFLPEDEQDAYFARGPLERVTRATITSQAKLRRELGEIRQRGYASSFGERQEGAGAVAAPLFAHDGSPTAVISVCGPVERFRDEVDACAAALVDVTSEASARLGQRAP